MIEKNLYTKENWDLRHINDINPNPGFDYENDMARRSMSDVMFRNPNLANFITRLQGQMVWMLESTLVVRNFFNHTCGKYFSGHNN